MGRRSSKVATKNYDPTQYRKWCEIKARRGTSIGTHAALSVVPSSQNEVVDPVSPGRGWRLEKCSRFWKCKDEQKRRQKEQECIRYQSRTWKWRWRGGNRLREFWRDRKCGVTNCPPWLGSSKICYSDEQRINSKDMINSLEEGVQPPHLTGLTLTTEALFEMMKLSTSYLFLFSTNVVNSHSQYHSPPTVLVKNWFRSCLTFLVFCSFYVVHNLPLFIISFFLV